MFQIALIVIGIVVAITVLVSLADNLIQIEAKKQGIDTEKNNLSLFPSPEGMFKPSVPNFAKSGNYHKLKKGYNLKIAGAPEGSVSKAEVKRFSIRPQNFRGNAPIPKMLVEVGAEVKAGDPLFFDKTKPDIHYCAPVSGEVIEINRGAKRSIIDVVILADNDQKYRQYDIPSLEDVSREDLVGFIKSSGMWGSLVQRPFGVVADPSISPRDIFISGLDTGPMAPNPNLLAAGRENDLSQGIAVLAKLTDGKVYLSTGTKDNQAFQVPTQAELHYFDGPHPAGNVGVQIHHIKPIRGTDVVWTMTVADVLALGHLFNTGNYYPQRVVAIGGQVSNPNYVLTTQGANIGELLKGQEIGDNVRIIAGDVLTGVKVSQDDYLNASDDQVTVIKEGNYHEPFGWLLPIKPRPSLSVTFPSFGNLAYEVDTNTHGEERAFVVTGQYEKVMPMDIYPQHLMKAILTGNIERMEGLGINELLEEDIALAEFSCTSKQPLQSILRDGLDMMREQV